MRNGEQKKPGCNCWIIGGGDLIVLEIGITFELLL
jgi:hypothetical protein